MSAEDDSVRYRAYLQKSLLSEGWDEFFDYERLRNWVELNRERLRARARATLGPSASTDNAEKHFATVVENFAPISKYDLPTTEAIFRPLLEEIAAVAASIGLSPTRPVELVTSTSIAPTPFARPTTGVHQLFIGPGTYAFCNYWAKAYTAIVKALAKAGNPSQPVRTADEFKERIRHDPSGIMLATRLCLHYAISGTVLGFGSVDQPAEYLGYRMELLRAMEVFGLAHEYCHFLADERGLRFADEIGDESAEGLEYFCDALGMQICREWGSQNSNWLAFAGVGAIAFFRAVELCEACAAHMAALRQDKTNNRDDSHPPVRDRMVTLINHTIETTDDDQRAAVKAFLTEYDLICSTIGDNISAAFAEVATRFAN